VYKVNANSLGLNDITTSNFEYLTISSGILYYGSNSVGNVTNDQLTSNINYIQTQFTNSLNATLIVRRYIAVGNSGISNQALGSIKYSDNATTWNNVLGGTQGFYNGGIDIATSPKIFYVACGNNYIPNDPFNLGFIQWSSDGLIWNNSVSPPLSIANLRSRVSYANGLWHAVGLGSDSNAILWSSDGKRWNASMDVASMFDSPGFNSIVYGRNIWVACGSNSFHSAYSMIFSTDGSNWNPNPTLNTVLNPFYDITFTGYTFIALTGNSVIFPNALSGNIVVSVSGSNDSTIIPVNFNNESGFVANNGVLAIAVTLSHHKYSLDFGYTWNDIIDFPVGNPGRPYYDGSLWWVPMSNDNTSNLYYSSTGSNLWKNNYLAGDFNSGFSQSVVSVNLSSNLNIQLISTITSIEKEFTISSFNVNVISTGSFTITNFINNYEDVLNISSFNSNAYVSINILSTTTINTSTLYVDSIQTSNIDISSINVSTIYVSNYLYTPELVSEYISTSSLYFSDLTMSSMFVSNLSTNSINVNSISSGIVTTEIHYSDIMSTNIAVISTINLIDNSTGINTELNASNGNIYFEGQKLLTTVATNPLFFTYQLQDNSPPSPGSIPGGPGFFTTDSDDLTTIQTVNFSVTDYYNKVLIGLFSKIAVYSILYIINQNTLKESIYLIERITPSVSLSYFTLKLTQLVGVTNILTIGEFYNFYVGNIGIKPPPSPPSDVITVKAGIIGSSFNFQSAFHSVPANIGTYSAGSTGFTINLNSIYYNTYNIPATVGSITFYDGNKYVQVNVKYGSINTSSGTTISIDTGVNNLVISGLSRQNFGAVDDRNSYAIYITIKLLN
jgi:hypothetical protein